MTAPNSTQILLFSTSVIIVVAAAAVVGSGLLRLALYCHHAAPTGSSRTGHNSHHPLTTAPTTHGRALMPQIMFAILQILIDGVILLLPGDLQRSHPFLVLEADVGAGSDQLFDDRQMTEEGRGMQGRFTVRDQTQIRTVFEQLVDHRTVAFVGGFEECRGTVLQARKEGDREGSIVLIIR